MELEFCDATIICEPGVGIQIVARATIAYPWFSWKETVEFHERLGELIQEVNEAKAKS